MASKAKAVVELGKGSNRNVVHTPTGTTADSCTRQVNQMNQRLQGLYAKGWPGVKGVHLSGATESRPHGFTVIEVEGRAQMCLVNEILHIANGGKCREAPPPKKKPDVAAALAVDSDWEAAV